MEIPGATVDRVVCLAEGIMVKAVLEWAVMAVDGGEDLGDFSDRVR